jgi:RNA polymerase sigma factor (sigma-70 family)
VSGSAKTTSAGKKHLHSKISNGLESPNTSSAEPRDHPFVFRFFLSDFSFGGHAIIEMRDLNDIDLLRRFGTKRSEEAFSILVARHLDLVYSAALRQVRDPHLAKDVSQSVFLRLAKKAGALKSGTILSGWLYRTTQFVARETLRSEYRRRARETAAMQTLTETPNHSPWEEIEPLLDEAIADLNEQDRNLVLLRYFESKSFREVGRQLGISEDAAQKRATRALEKLRGSLAFRGAAVSAATLGGLLSPFAIQAAPAGLSATVVEAVVSAGATTSIFTVQTILEIMTLNKKAVAVAALFAATLTIPIISQKRALQEAREENSSLKAELDQLQARLQPEAARPLITAPELARLRQEATEVHRLRGEITLLRQANQNRANAPASVDGNPIDPAAMLEPMQRMNLARELRTQGRHAEALDHFLWCFDEGLKHSPAFAGVRSSFLLNDLAELAEVYPPALEAMLARRDAAEAAIAGGSFEHRALFDYHQLNERMNQPEQTTALFDQLAPGHRAREGLVEVAFEQFIRTQRYVDVLEAGNPEKHFDQARFVASSAGERGDEALVMRMRRRAVEQGAFAVEALAGASATDRAAALVETVLAFDSSPESRGILLRHAQRAGNLQIAAHIQHAIGANQGD